MLLIKAEDLRTRMVMVKTVPMMKAVVCGLLCERVVLRCYVEKKKNGNVRIGRNIDRFYNKFEHLF